MSEDNKTALIIASMFFTVMVAVVISVSLGSYHDRMMNYEIKIRAIKALKSNVELKLNTKDLKELLR